LPQARGSRCRASRAPAAVLNETARSMGQPDIDPFVLNRPVVTKLHFIQCVVEDQAGGAQLIDPPESL
jgi:hypothetical protein